MADIAKLKTILASGHPETGAYDADNVIALAQMTLGNITRNKTTMTGREIAAEANELEYKALSDAKKAQFLALTSGADVDPFGFAVNAIKDIFGPTSDTVIALALARVEVVSHVELVGAGQVRVGHVAIARS